MNIRKLTFSAIAVALQIPMFVMAAGLVPCGGANEAACQTCHVVQLVDLVNAWLIGILSLVASVMFMIAGFRLVTANGNPSVMTDAKNMIVNVAIGFMIVLSAWIIIDTGMKALLQEEASEGFGPWNKIACLDQPESGTTPGTLDIERVQTNDTCTTAAACQTLVQSCQGRPGGVETITGSPGNFQVTCAYTSTSASGGGGGRVTPGGRGEAQCAADNTNCSVQLLQSLGLSETQANIMSCVAVTENSGGSVGCSGTGPCGTFQITRTNWGIYTNGAGADHPDCSASNFGGNLISAQNNGACNARVMTSMVRDSGYQPWTGAHSGQAPWNPYARGCVNTHGNAGDSTRRGF